MKTIFRSWNWPSYDSDTFSQRPTPYHISKNSYLNPGSVYKEWNTIFARNFVKKVIFLPSSNIARRSTVMVIDITKREFDAVVEKFSDVYFVEMIHTGHVYEAAGEIEVMKNIGWILVLELIYTSAELLPKQVKVLSEVIGKDYHINVIWKENPFHDVRLDGDSKFLSRHISYRSIYDVDVERLSRELGKSRRTVIRKLDLLLKQRHFIAFPVLNQAAISGFNVFVVSIKISNESNASTILREALKLPSISENYLLYRTENTSLFFLLSNDSIAELEKCVNELHSAFSDFMVITRFETFLNKDLDLIIG